MKREIRLYIEGAGKSHEAIRLRKGFRIFLDPLYQLARRNGFKFHEPITCCDGPNTYKDFKAAYGRHKDAMIFLLVDAEEAVAKGVSPWVHLKCDSLGLDDSHCHLMVQTMEAWLIADKDALANFYQKDFNRNALPQNPRVEEIPKKDLFDGLHDATAKTKKGRYHKTLHAPEILKRLDVAKVRQAAPHCERLFKTLTEKMS